MRMPRRFGVNSAILAVLAAVWLSVLPLRLNAQNNAVYDSTGTTTVQSTALVDAHIVSINNNNSDLCGTIYTILKPATYSPAVIDARGLSGSVLTCATGTSPWNNGTTYVNKPSVILLPAGTITTSIPWVLPSNTKLIGTAKGNPGQVGGNHILETTIQPPAPSAVPPWSSSATARIVRPAARESPWSI